MDDEDLLVKIIDEHEEEDGSVTLTIEAPEFLINFWKEKYGTDDFGTALFTDILEYAKTLTPEEIKKYATKKDN